MLSLLSNFQVSFFDQPSYFTNPSVEVFPSDFDVGTSNELYNVSPHASTGSTEDDLPAGNVLDNFEPSFTFSSISPIDVAYDIIESPNELVVPSSSRLTRARLVAKAFIQEYGIDYEETFAPVAHLPSVCSLLAIAVIQRSKLFQMDVKNSFLNGDLEEEVYMKSPPGLNHPPNKILGLEVTSSDDGYLLSQVKYAFDLVSKAELNDSKNVSTPIEPNVKLTPMYGFSLSDPTHYLQLVGSLVYFTMIHLDIAYAVHIVSEFMASPRSTYYVAVLRIICYVKGTLFHGFTFLLTHLLNFVLT
ncbi:hypothetical protein SLEP1_g53967 [Rubroshorea leprosula]|uniref:Reverse transcriptase Ty1/copia-type domain-containing protein n=1 Tax=Rubroshorea leprosula TaxID=152421 RepID=A0AAV5MCT6_9ROSI|nr:hypothetical protein SLEP1_g53967 [Rubroshorea leprosula]